MAEGHARKPMSFMFISCEKFMLEHLVAAVRQASLSGLDCTAVLVLIFFLNIFLNIFNFFL